MIIDAFRLDGKVALVTGSSTGLGAGIAVALAEAGADVAVHGNSRDALATADRISGLGRRALALRGDLADRAVPADLVKRTIGELGRLDILVNNAGIIRRAPALEYS